MGAVIDGVVGDSMPFGIGCPPHQLTAGAEIYVEPGKRGETGFAMGAIKKAMKWDEDVFGLEYDLDRFMMVAVGFFNMGAMENKGLNIFNDACVLGPPETATDGTIASIERAVAHEFSTTGPATASRAATGCS